MKKGASGLSAAPSVFVVLGAFNPLNLNLNLYSS